MVINILLSQADEKKLQETEMETRVSWIIDIGDIEKTTSYTDKSSYSQAPSQMKCGLFNIMFWKIVAIKKYAWTSYRLDH